MPELERPKYFRKLLVQAARETWQLVTAVPGWTFVIALAVAVLTIYLQRHFGSMSDNQMKEAIMSLVYGLGSVLIAYCLAFLFHLLVLTPKHLYLEEHKRAHTAEAQLSELTAIRPDFFYEGIGSQVVPRIIVDPADGQAVAQIDFSLRFKNQGKGTAYNLSSKIYACWMNDNPLKPTLADKTQPSVGRTRPDEAKSLVFSAQHYRIKNNKVSAEITPDDVLLILVEIQFRIGSQMDSPICKNEPIWKIWDPRVPNTLCDANESVVQIAQESIDRLKTKLATAKLPPS